MKQEMPNASFVKLEAKNEIDSNHICL
jgi:hypothetical protein